MTTRATIVAEALSWEATPYHHRARVKGIGVDCAQLPIAIYSAVGMMPAIQPGYASDWMLHRDEEVFLAIVREHGVEIERADVQPGDFAIWKFGRTYSHGAIVIDAPVILHAVIKGGGVIRGDMDRDEELASRPVRFFSMFGAE